MTMDAPQGSVAQYDAQCRYTAPITDSGFDSNAVIGAAIAQMNQDGLSVNDWNIGTPSTSGFFQPTVNFQITIWVTADQGYLDAGSIQDTITNDLEAQGNLQVLAAQITNFTLPPGAPGNPSTQQPKVIQTGSSLPAVASPTASCVHPATLAQVLSGPCNFSDYWKDFTSSVGTYSLVGLVVVILLVVMVVIVRPDAPGRVLASIRR